jgi:hypothetical protein
LSEHDGCGDFFELAIGHLDRMPSVNKYQRYRQKCLREGRCAHCGKPCAPYLECDDRRTYKKINRIMRRLVECGFAERVRPGVIKVTPDGQFAPMVMKRSGADHDKRLWPRIADMPVSVDALVHAAVLDVAHASANRIFTEAQVEARIADIRCTYSKRRRAP